MLDVPQLDALEAAGAYEQALKILSGALRCGEMPHSTDEMLHRLGRLHQRLQHNICSEKAYSLALSINPNRASSINNLAVLKMAALDYSSAEELLGRGLKIANLNSKELALLLNSLCELRLYQFRPRDAAELAQKQVELSDTTRARVNLGIALRNMNDLHGSLEQHKIGLQKMVGRSSISDNEIKSFIGFVRDEGIGKTLQTHLAIMNYAVARLSLNNLDDSAQNLLLAGAAIEPFAWHDPLFFKRMWRGQQVDKLVLWHDQGYGDAIQNLAWIETVCERVGELKLLLRPSLVRLVVERLRLPINCRVEAMTLDTPPWKQADIHLGLWFVPLVLGGWHPKQSALQAAALKRSATQVVDSDRPRIGLVWMAGRHKAPQPELAARMRDVPFSCFQQRLSDWKKRFNANCFCLQSGHEHPLTNDVIDEVDTGNLELPSLDSGDWLTTTQVVESMDLVLTVDTAMAHLCGSLGVPCIVLLNAPCDWRWGQEGDRSFLYESVRLARCPFPNAWDHAMNFADRIINSWLG